MSLGNPLAGDPEQEEVTANTSRYKSESPCRNRLNPIQNRQNPKQAIFDTERRMNQGTEVKVSGELIGFSWAFRRTARLEPTK